MKMGAFRVREVSTGKIVDTSCTELIGYDFYIDRSGELCRVFYRDDVDEADDCYYEHWTGFTDRKGVKIYEGDKVRAWTEERSKIEQIFNSAEVTGVVIRDGIHFSILTDNNVRITHWDNAEQYEVLDK